MTEGFGHRRFLAPRHEASHAIRVPRVRILPSASFRSHLTMGPLAVRLGVPVIKASKGLAPSRHFPVGVRLPVDSARQGAARHAWRTSGRPGSWLTLAPGRRRRSPASGSHRTERADFPHSALRKLIHSTASACSSRCGRRKRGRCNVAAIRSSPVSMTGGSPLCIEGPLVPCMTLMLPSNDSVSAGRFPM